MVYDSCDGSARDAAEEEAGNRDLCPEKDGDVRAGSGPEYPCEAHPGPRHPPVNRIEYEKTRWRTVDLPWLDVKSSCRPMHESQGFDP